MVLGSGRRRSRAELRLSNAERGQGRPGAQGRGKLDGAYGISRGFSLDIGPSDPF